MTPFALCSRDNQAYKQTHTHTNIVMMVYILKVVNVILRKRTGTRLGWDFEVEIYKIWQLHHHNTNGEGIRLRVFVGIEPEKTLCNNVGGAE